jgi:hypothetical protein
MSRNKETVMIILRKLARRCGTYHNKVATFAFNNGRICPCCDIDNSLLPTNKIVGDAVIEVSKLVNHHWFIQGVQSVIDWLGGGLMGYCKIIFLSTSISIIKIHYFILGTININVLQVTVVVVVIIIIKLTNSVALVL